MSGTTVDLITKFGLPLSMLLIVVWTGKRGDWVFGWLYREATQRLQANIVSLQEELVAVRKQCREDMAKERSISDSLFRVGDRVATAAEKVVK